MGKLRCLLVGAAACLFLVAAQSLAIPAKARADDALGVWATEAEKSHVRIKPCGEALCGEIVWLKEPTGDDGKPILDLKNSDEALRDRPVLGIRIIKGMTPDGAAKWDDGKIYNPEDGKTYKSKMELTGPDTLKVKGCVLFICQSQIWQRVN